jgi:GntR family transcriptional regulator
MTTLQTLSLDRASPVPLYHQLRLSLEGWLRGRAEADAPVPTEAELSEIFGVSRITVRQALAAMLADGVLYRKRTRGRLFASSPKVHQQLTRLRGFFIDDVLAAGLAPCTRVISVEQVRGGAAAERLELGPDEIIWRVERLHEGDGAPMALQVSYVPKTVCPGLDQFDLSQSIYRLIAEHFGPMVRGAQRIGVRSATAEESGLLRLGRRAAVIDVERVQYTVEGIAAEYFTGALRADRYDFVLELDSENDDQSAAAAWPLHDRKGD